MRLLQTCNARQFHAGETRYMAMQVFGNPWKCGSSESPSQRQLGHVTDTSAEVGHSTSQKVLRDLPLRGCHKQGGHPVMNVNLRVSHAAWRPARAVLQNNGGRELHSVGLHTDRVQDRRDSLEDLVAVEQRLCPYFGPSKSHGAAHKPGGMVCLVCGEDFQLRAKAPLHNHCFICR